MSEPSWYEVVQGSGILQGDLLLHCPVPLFVGTLRWPVPPDAPPQAEVFDLDLIVLTQSCDLAHAHVQEVLLAELISWPDALRSEIEKGNAFIRSREFRKRLIEGNVPGLSLLHKHEGQPGLPWTIVEFHRLHSLSKEFIDQFAVSCGSRLRLRSPYREHLAQAFARYFMRVGLPHDARAFEKEGDVKV